jgi:aldehyde:ferredoxin oxidoreductase
VHSDDPLRRVLYVDLSHHKYWVEDRADLFEAWLGGTGVGIQLLTEECPEKTDAFGPRNPIILAVGPLVGIYPMASKTVAMFKSPHTGELGESHAGGRSAISLRLAGYGAVVIRGASATPVYLVIDGQGVRFRDASALWGLRSSYTVGAVIREREQGSGMRSIMRIGRAGERRVSYACVITETYRHFGRLGLGAVFGSKQLKGIVIQGDRSLPIADRKAFRKVYDSIFQAATGSELMRKYHELGTAMNVLPLNAMGALPTRNLQSGDFEGAESIAGERMAAEFLGRRVACAHCPVACIHLAALRTPYETDRYFYKTSMLGYDHEPIFATGSMLGISDVSGMLRLMDAIEVQGLDVMSTGVALAWATEAMARGLITSEDAGDLHLTFGEPEPYIEAVRRIVEQPNEFYEALAHGVEHAAAIYGGQGYAMSFGGNEMAGYHTGPGCHAGYLSGARHSHLDSAGYSIDERAAEQSGLLPPEELADSLLQEERWRQVLSSLVVCFFARKIYDPDMVLRALSPIGFDHSQADLDRMGADILKNKYAFKSREGFSLSKIRIPERIFETKAPAGEFDEEYMRATLRHYQRML